MLTQQNRSFLGPVPARPSRIPHLSRKKRGDLPNCLWVGKMPPLESSYTSVNGPSWHRPGHLLLLSPILAHQAQAEALISLPHAVVSMSALRVVPDRTAPCLPTSHCRMAAQQPRPPWAAAPTAPRHYNLASQGRSCGKRGAVHKTTAPHYTGSSGC